MVEKPLRNGLFGACCAAPPLAPLRLPEAASQAGRLFMVCTTRKARAQLTGAINFRPPARTSCRVKEAALARDDLRLTHFVVIAGLDPAIHLFARVLAKQMDARVKPAHDDST